MPKKKPQEGKPQVHKDLEGFEVIVNEFGEILSNRSSSELNDFLNENVDDKKLVDRDDLDFIANKKQEEEEAGALESEADIEENELNLEDIKDKDLINLKPENEDE